MGADEPQFTNARFKGCGAFDIVNVVREKHHFGHAAPCFRTVEVAHDTTAQIGRRSDVERNIVGVTEYIDAVKMGEGIRHRPLGIDGTVVVSTIGG